MSPPNNNSLVSDFSELGGGMDFSSLDRTDEGIEGLLAARDRSCMPYVTIQKTRTHRV